MGQEGLRPRLSVAAVDKGQSGSRVKSYRARRTWLPPTCGSPDRRCASKPFAFAAAAHMRQRESPAFLTETREALSAGFVGSSTVYATNRSGH
jgi:hypothetical protein